MLSAGALAGVTWLGAQLAALLAGKDALSAGIGDALAALTRLPSNLSDSKAVWAPEFRANLPGPVLCWPSTVAVVLAIGAVALLVWRVVRGHRDALDRRERLGVPTQGRLATSRPPSPPHPTPAVGTIRRRSARPPPDRD